MMVREYIKQDRQWKRELRIAHAALMLGKARAAKDSKVVAFWEAVLVANGELPPR